MTTREKVLEWISQSDIDFDQLSEDQKALFVDQAEFDDHKRILNSTSRWITPAKISQEEAWSNIEERISPVTDSRPYSKFRWMSVAAVISLLVVATFLFLPKDEAVIVASELTEIKQIELPDGSSVILNPLSSVSYDVNWDNRREVSLKGKARFNVKEGSTFSVLTEQYLTTVLGTSFDVSFEKGQLEVSCYSGRVKVGGASQTEEIGPGEKLYISDNEFVKKRFDATQVARWVKGEFYFDNVPLSEVIAELERQFGLQVSGADRDERLYKGYFYKDNINRALELVFKPMGYDYTLEDQVVTIK